HHGAMPLDERMKCGAVAGRRAGYEVRIRRRTETAVHCQEYDVKRCAMVDRPYTGEMPSSRFGSSEIANPLRRNLAIIAHVDHGKNTLVDGFLRQRGAFESNERVAGRARDET